MFCSTKKFDNFNLMLTFEIAATEKWMERVKSGFIDDTDRMTYDEIADGGMVSKANTLARAAITLETLKDIQKEYLEKYKE